MASARKKVLADLHLQGEYYVAGEEDSGGQGNGRAGGGGLGNGEDGADGAVGENGYANGAVREFLIYLRLPCIFANEASSVLSEVGEEEGEAPWREKRGT